MSEVNLEQKAREVYETLCAALDEHNWHYTKDESMLLVRFTVTGEDLPIAIIMVVDQKRQLVRLLTRLPFTIGEERRMDLAVATCAVTDRLVNGSFDFDILKGTITFRMTASYRESVLGKGLFTYMMDASCATVDDYNDKFLAINKGYLALDDFLKD